MKLVGDVRRPLYNSICHERCYIESIDEETVGHHDLQQCSAFIDNEICSNCGLHWQHHMHIRDSQIESTVRDIDPGVQKKQMCPKSS